MTSHDRAGLIARGHRVTLAMESHHRGMVEEVVGASALSEGRVELVGLKGDFEDVQRSDAWQHAVRHRLTWLLVRMVEVSPGLKLKWPDRWLTG